jgi:hypothetical protein
MEFDKETAEQVNSILDKMSGDDPDLQNYYDKTKVMFDKFDDRQKVDYIFGLCLGIQVRLNRLEVRLNET